MVTCTIFGWMLKCKLHLFRHRMNRKKNKSSNKSNYSNSEICHICNNNHIHNQCNHNNNQWNSSNFPIEEVLRNMDGDSNTLNRDKPTNRSFPGLSTNEEKQWLGPFCFIQAADPQFGLIDGWNGVPDDEITWEKEIALTNKAFECINKLKPRPKFVSICGDLVDAAPGTKMHNLQNIDLKKCIQNLDSEMPLLCLPGNHDIGNTPTDETIVNYKLGFGDDYYSFFAGGAFFIVINNQLHKDASKVPELLAKHDKWLEEQLSIAKSRKYKHAVIFQHIPLFHDSADEDEDYFNIEPTLRQTILSKLEDAGIRHVFAGHYHRNAGGKHGDIEMTVTSAIGCQIGDDKSGMRIVRVFETHIDHKYYDFDNFPEEISLQENIALP